MCYWKLDGSTSVDSAEQHRNFYLNLYPSTYESHRPAGCTQASSGLCVRFASRCGERGAKGSASGVLETKFLTLIFQKSEGQSRTESP